MWRGEFFWFGVRARGKTRSRSNECSLTLGLGFLGRSLRYRDAFIACRKHRIDLNILYDHDPAGFMKNLSTFVEQIEDVDYINLFLGGLK